MYPPRDGAVFQCPDHDPDLDLDPDLDHDLDPDLGLDLLFISIWQFPTIRYSVA